MNRHALIRLALQGLSLSGATRWLPRAPSAAGFVVTLHHVLPARHAAFDPNALLSITPEFLDRFLGHFIGRGWQFLPVDELLSPGHGAGVDHRRIAVTLDDGYRDNLEHAWPVFRRHSVPFTIYACPGFCDRTAELWWEALERIIRSADELPRPGGGDGGTIPARTPAEKHRAFKLWTAWLTTDADEMLQRRAIRALADRHGLDLTSLAGELVMDWDEIRAMEADPLCSIGAHTMTHPALARLPADTALAEMRSSADRIEAEIGVRPATIAFPYGYPAAASSREATLAARAGFSGSFTTSPGFMPAGGSRHGLPRVSINGLFQDLRFLELLLEPGLWTLRSRLGKTR